MKFNPARANKPVSLRRHRRDCSICKHPDRKEIERKFIGWLSPERIQAEHGVSRDAQYRHAHAYQLLDARRRNVRAALERLIERAEGVEITAAAVVSAVISLSKINAHGQYIDRIETVNLSALFERMSTKELDTYAKDGTLPDWFERTIGATREETSEESDAS